MATHVRRGRGNSDCALVLSEKYIIFRTYVPRLKPIKLGNQEIHFKYAAPSRLYWADRPAMRVVQALHWIQDMLAQDSERQRVQTVLHRLFANPRHGKAIRDDLRTGLSALPIWMQESLRGLLSPADADEMQP